MSITIRPIKSPEDGRAIEEIAITAWGSDGLDAIPGHLSLTVAKENGGVILLCFDGKRPIGFCWGFWAYQEESQKWKCASHQAGVIPDYKGKGIGERLKWAQRNYVMKRGFDHMTWTFDPLETINGALNIRKLGAVCKTYYRNLYGELHDSLNRGIPTDRFMVDWWLGTGWVETHADKSFMRLSLGDLENSGMLFLNRINMTQGYPQPVEVDHGDVIKNAPPYLVINVPRNYQRVKRLNQQAAIDWRHHTRELFESAFSANYSAVDLLASEAVCHYVLQREWNRKQ